jgi:hypothetical protein
MCQRKLCEQCQKPTYSGCGKHVEQVLRAVPVEDRCHCMALGSTSIKYVGQPATAYESPR